MRSSRLSLATITETSTDAKYSRHELTLRTSMILSPTTCLYTWMPLGLRLLRKVERIIREEMDRSGAQEVLMPVVQPSDLWEQSGRWQEYGPELLRISDRHGRSFCLGPTHEEVITALIRGEIS